jgi:molybdate transport system permease protein
MASARRDPGSSFALALTGLAVVGSAFFILPLAGLVLRAPWSRTVSLLTSSFSLDALKLSAVVGASATGLSLAAGVPLAWLLARGRFPGRFLLRGLVTVPMVLPPVVAGIALLAAFGREGVIGGPLEEAGLEVSLSTIAAILAATFVAAPFLVLSVEAGFARVDPELEDAARTMGAGEWRVFRTVTLPALRPALAAGGALCLARALGEFGATITFAGNLRGRTQTAPLAIFESFQTDPGLAVLMSLLLLVPALLLLILLRVRLWG